eukprot:scaffold877_cov362-Prasinococcus_capsulatus_cf.AAC.2
MASVEGAASPSASRPSPWRHGCDKTCGGSTGNARSSRAGRKRDIHVPVGGLPGEEHDPPPSFPPCPRLKPPGSRRIG